MKEINSYDELQSLVSSNEKAYLLLYKQGSEQSECALTNLKKAMFDNDKVGIYITNVARVRDIHTRYNITTAPSMIEFEKGTFKNVVKGCHDPSYFRAIFEDAVYHAETKDTKPTKRVTVYSTPTCHWCTTLKTYLKKNRIPFRDVDVSRDQNAAEALVQKSGQQGVPQTEINGQMVVGFDQAKLKRLLEIQ